MNTPLAWNLVQWRSPRARVTLVTLFTFLSSVWLLALYASRVLSEDMQRLLGEQQHSATSFVAEAINQQLTVRMQALETVALGITPALFTHTQALQQLLEQRPLLQNLFNAGIFVTGAHGTAIADVPLSAARIGINYSDRNTVAMPLKDGKSIVGRPAMGKKLGAPIFSLGVPSRDGQGAVLGVLVGTVNLGLPNFLEELAQGHYGHSGGFLLMAPQHGLFVTATDKSRIMQPLPAPGRNPMHDRFMQGYEGWGVATSSRGVQELSAAKRIPAAGWLVATAVPTSEVFGPITRMQQQIVLAAALLSVLALFLAAWTHRLLGTLALREQTLWESEARQRAIVDNEPDCIKIVDEQGRLAQMNPAGLAMIGADSLEQVRGLVVSELVVPEYREAFVALHQRVLDGESARLEFEIVGLKGLRRRVETHAVPMPLDGGTVQLAVTRDVTQRRMTEVALLLSEQRFGAAFRLSPVASSITTAAEGRFLEVNANFERDLGWSGTELIGRTSMEVGLWPDQAMRQSWLQAMLAQGRLLGYEAVWVHKNGEYRNVSISGEVVELAGQTCIFTATSDITERKRADAELRIAATAFESQEGMTITDAQGVILRVNHAFTEITGYTQQEALGQTLLMLCSDRQDPNFYAAMWESIGRTGSWQGEIWNQRKSGEAYPQWLSVTAVEGLDGVATHYVGTFADISLRKTAQDEMAHLAFYDHLTQLPNRRLMLDRLNQALSNSERQGHHGALMLIDLDNFKALNDTQGHAAGDRLLVDVASRLELSIREGDTVARLGGDEFVVILEGLDGGDQAAVQAQLVAQKIRSRLNEPYLLEPHLADDQPYARSHHCTCSIGITLFRDQSVSVDELVKRADTAMYQAKSDGRNALRFFDPTMQAAVQARAEMELDLRKAVEQQQFVLHYQPQLDLAGRVIGAEALVRWQHPQRGLLVPAEFISLAEETRLIVPLGCWVLEAACKQLAAWSGVAQLSHLSLAVNVSARQFGLPDFAQQVASLVQRCGARADRLKLELSESLLLENAQEVIDKMVALKAQGVSFALDDFGTGYSSLSYLKRLPLDELRIDKSFVNGILSNPNDAAIARTIVALAQTMGMSVIAEGVETLAQRDFLANCGCHHYQGYLFSRPLPLPGFEAYALGA